MFSSINPYSLFKKIAFNIDPEVAHELTIKSMKMLAPWVTNKPGASDPRFHLTAMGLNFQSPIGLAAGLDKNAEAVSFLSTLPFSFIEVGTVTPVAQKGNDKPRLFRYAEEESLRNCMGFNNVGMEQVYNNIKLANLHGKLLGVNLGKNKNTPNDQAAREYATLYKKFAPISDYLVINVSSPNTPGLRDLLQDSGLRDIFSEVSVERRKIPRPLLVKVSPDMDREQLLSVAELVKEFQLSGIMATNTTIMPERGAGGVSGKLLYLKAKLTREYLLEILKETPEIDLIGVGGFSCYEDLKDFWMRGGGLIQIYSSFVFQGPGLLFKIEKMLAADMERVGANNFLEFRQSLKNN